MSLLYFICVNILYYVKVSARMLGIKKRCSVERSIAATCKVAMSQFNYCHILIKLLGTLYFFFPQQ